MYLGQVLVWPSWSQTNIGWKGPPPDHHLLGGHQFKPLQSQAKLVQVAQGLLAQSSLELEDGDPTTSPEQPVPVLDCLTGLKCESFFLKSN